MHTRWIRTLALGLMVAMLGVLACDVSSLIGGVGGGAAKPTVVIQSPANGAQFREGEDIAVQSTARDQSGITRVELSVDGAAVRTDTPPVPQGQVAFTLIQKWKAISGSHTLTVRAFNASGTASDPALVSIIVAAGTASTPTTASVLVVPTTESPLTGPGATATALFVSSPIPTAPLATATRRPPTRVPATTTPSAPPGIYAASIRVDPAAPKRGQNVTFYVTFFNNTGSAQDYRWRVRIYLQDAKNGFGDTSPLNNTIVPGTSELASADNWGVRGPGDCMQLVARVFWIDTSSKAETEFVKPDQSGGPATGFQVCP